MSRGQVLGIFCSLSLNYILVFAQARSDLANPSRVSQSAPAVPAGFTNGDILSMQAAGIAPDVIVAKVKSSACDFDTSAASLSQLKAAAVPDSVLLALVTCGSKNDNDLAATKSQAPQMTTFLAPRADAIRGYALAYVKSERKWKFGVRSEPYDKISEHLQQQLGEALNQKGFVPLPLLKDGCCEVVVELLEVTIHPAMFKKPGMDVSATVSVKDSSGQLLFSKGYRGESRTMMNTYGHLINHAVEDMAMNIVSDDALIRVLGTGRLN